MSDEVPLQPAPPPEPVKPSFDLAKVLLMALILVGIAGAVYAVIYFRNQTATRNDQPSPLQLSLTKQASNSKLGEDYQDADGDLIADTPADAKIRLIPTDLTFATVPGEDQAEAEKVWRPFVDLLSKKTGRPVRFLIEEKSSSPRAAAAAAPGSDSSSGEGRSLDAQLQLVRAGKLHIAAFTGGQIPRAVNSAGFVPLFVPAAADGQYTIETVVIVPADSPIASVPDLKKQLVAMVNLSSVTGGRAPMVLFKEQFGMIPGRDYDYFETGSHRESIRQVADGRAPAACVASDVLQQMADEKDGVPADKYKVIFRAGKFPPMTFGLPHNFDPELRATIEECFKEFSFSGTAVGEKYKGRARFVPVNYKADWQSVREIDEKLTKLLE